MVTMTPKLTRKEVKRIVRMMNMRIVTKAHDTTYLDLWRHNGVYIQKMDRYSPKGKLTLELAVSTYEGSNDWRLKMMPLLVSALKSFGFNVTQSYIYIDIMVL